MPRLRRGAGELGKEPFGGIEPGGRGRDEVVRSGGVASEPNAIGKRCVLGELKIASSLPVASNRDMGAKGRGTRPRG
jgi:hypothetical protein